MDPACCACEPTGTPYECWMHGNIGYWLDYIYIEPRGLSLTLANPAGPVVNCSSCSGVAQNGWGGPFGPYAYYSAVSYGTCIHWLATMNGPDPYSNCSCKSQLVINRGSPTVSPYLELSIYPPYRFTVSAEGRALFRHSLPSVVTYEYLTSNSPFSMSFWMVENPPPVTVDGPSCQVTGVDLPRGNPLIYFPDWI